MGQANIDNKTWRHWTLENYRFITYVNLKFYVTGEQVFTSLTYCDMDDGAHVQREVFVPL